MALVVRAFPVRNREGVDAFVRELRERADETREFYAHYGVRREAWFYQHVDEGAFVIGVTDVSDPVEAKAAEYAAETDGFAAWFKARVYALSGIDPDVAPLGPVTEQVHASDDGPLPEGATLIVRAYPLRSRDALLEFVHELHAKPREMRDFYRRHLVEESWFVQELGGGPMAIAVLATDHPNQIARSFGESQLPYDVWFKRRVSEVSGVDPNVTPLGPPSEPIFDFEAP